MRISVAQKKPLYFSLIALIIFIATLLLQSEHLNNAAEAEELLYLESLKCPPYCNYIKSFFELHLPTIKFINSMLYYFFERLLPLRVLGCIWFSLFGTSFYFLCRRFFNRPNSTIITAATLLLPIIWSYATSFENLMPLLFFITMLINATHDNDDKKVNLWVICAGLVHISGLLFSPAIIFCYLLKSGFHQIFHRFKTVFIFIAFYALYIALLILGRKLLGWDHSSHRVDRHFDIPFTLQQLSQNFSGCLYILEKYTPLILVVIIPVFSFYSKKKDNLLINQTSALLFSFVVLQSSYNSFSLKNGAIAAIFCLLTFVVIFKDVLKERLTAFIIVSAFFSSWHLPEGYMTGRYRLPTLRMQLGYNYQVIALIESYAKKCSISLSNNMALYSNPIYGYSKAPLSLIGTEANSDIIVQHYQSVNEKDILKIPNEINSKNHHYNHRLIFHNLSAFSTRPLEKLEGLTPTLQDHFLKDHKVGMALVFYSHRPDCLK